YYSVLRLGTVLAALLALTILACLAFVSDAGYAPAGSASGPPWSRLLVVVVLAIFLAAWGCLEILIQRCFTEGTHSRQLRANAPPVSGDIGAGRGTEGTFGNPMPAEKKYVQMRRLLEKLRRSRAQARRQNQELLAQATRDPLTGCLNRRALFVEFETLWSTAIRYSHPLSCLM